MDYPCTGCGECCRRIQSVLEASHDHPLMQQLVDRFPYQVLSDGSCEMLTEDGRCSVYEHRPLICNIKMGGVFLGVDQMEWYRMNMEGCNSMMERAGLDSSLRVSLKNSP